MERCNNFSRSDGPSSSSFAAASDSLAIAFESDRKSVDDFVM